MRVLQSPVPSSRWSWLSPGGGRRHPPGVSLNPRPAGPVVSQAGGPQGIGRSPAQPHDQTDKQSTLLGRRGVTYR